MRGMDCLGHHLTCREVLLVAVFVFHGDFAGEDVSEARHRMRVPGEVLMRVDFHTGAPFPHRGPIGRGALGWKVQ